jgi:hypothetical protein
LGRGLEGVNRKVKQNLDQFRGIDLGLNIAGQSLDEQLMSARRRVGAEQVSQVGEHLVYRHGGIFCGRLAQESQVAMGNLDAVLDLAPDEQQAMVDLGYVLPIQSGCLSYPVADGSDIPSDDR